MLGLFNGSSFITNSGCRVADWCFCIWSVDLVAASRLGYSWSPEIVSLRGLFLCTMEWLLGPVDLSLLRWFVCSRFRCCVGLYAPGFFGYVVPLGVKEWGAPSLSSRLGLRSLLGAKEWGASSLSSRLD